MLKKTWLFIVVVLLAVGCTQQSTDTAAGDEQDMTAGSRNGPPLDKMYMSARTQQDIALRDVAEGTEDYFMVSVSAATFRELPRDVRDKLEVYRVPSGSWSLLINPIPNAEPYTVEKQGETYFNPFAVSEIRYALNFLIDRQKLVDELYAGDGGVMYTPMNPVKAGSFRWNLEALKRGFTATGDEQKAIDDITAAMETAAALPQNQGRLVKDADGYWAFDGDREKAKIQFLIRVDDPNGRLKSGHYIADQLEKAGLWVERLEYDRYKCSDIVYGGDPASYDYNMYTEGWGAGSSTGYWDIQYAQMYAPHYGYMPGGANSENWNYTNDEIDRLSKKYRYGNFEKEEEYWQGNMKAINLALDDAVRLYILYSNSYFVANKEKFKQRFAYNAGTGTGKWSYYTALVDPDANGEKSMRMVQFTARGSLFMGSWNPIGTDGFNDLYMNKMTAALTDMPGYYHPATSQFFPVRADWKDVETQLEVVGDEVIGKIAVPSTAMEYNSQTDSWESMPAGTTAISKATYTYDKGSWHNGRPINMTDLIYARGFYTEWGRQDGDDDKQFNAPYSAMSTPVIDIRKGFEVIDDYTVTTYFDYNFPMNKGMVASYGMPTLKVLPPGFYAFVTWEINEALARIVVNGSESGTVYDFTNQESTVEPDLIVPGSVADILAELKKMQAEKYIPVYIKDYTDEAEVLADYEASIAFIEEYGHAYISNGAYMLSKMDAQNNFAEFTAFRDEGYPFAENFWVDELQVDRTQIDQANVADVTDKSQDLEITLNVSQLTWPQDAPMPAGNGVKTSAIIVLPDREEVVDGEYVADGNFRIIIPATLMQSLDSGSYTMIIQSMIADENPGIATSQLVIY